MAVNFNKYAQEGNKFLKDYAYDMNLGNDKEKAGRILVSILHSLRDIIPRQESLQFISQLPMFLKGLYVHGWSSKKKKVKIKRFTEFLDLVKKHDGPAAVNDFEYNDEVAEHYIRTTFIFLRKYVSFGEMEDIMDNLPKELKHLIYHNVLF